ncbi:unnamed protein product [Leptosia nina]|uniref:Uncharacterized protein n=1 Tax=Leptosia nina TaxID=320188 RepID=A0AAV1JZA5_9NEOP
MLSEFNQVTRGTRTTEQIELYNLLCDAAIDSAVCCRRMHKKPILGWNHYVKNSYRNARNHFAKWVLAGKPVQDDVNIVPVGEDLTLHEDSHEQLESLNTDDSGEMYVSYEDETLDSSESGATNTEDSIILDNVNAISGPRRKQKPDRFGFANTCTEDELMCTGEISLHEALKGPEKAQWLAAVQEELQSFEKNSAWELVDVPKDRSLYYSAVQPTRPPFGDFTVAVAHCVAAAMVGGGQRVRGLTVAAGYCETVQTAGPRLGGISAAKNQY